MGRAVGLLYYDAVSSMWFVLHRITYRIIQLIRQGVFSFPKYCCLQTRDDVCDCLQLWLITVAALAKS